MKNYTYNEIDSMNHRQLTECILNEPTTTAKKYIYALRHSFSGRSGYAAELQRLVGLDSTSAKLKVLMRAEGAFSDPVLDATEEAYTFVVGGVYADHMVYDVWYDGDSIGRISYLYTSEEIMASEDMGPDAWVAINSLDIDPTNIGDDIVVNLDDVYIANAARVAAIRGLEAVVNTDLDDSVGDAIVGAIVELRR